MSTEAKRETRQIVSGWTHLLVRKDGIERLARRRMAICTGCEHRRKLVCGLCGCPLAAKQRAADASCPIARW